MKQMLLFLAPLIISSCAQTKKTGAAFIPKGQGILKRENATTAGGTDYIYPITLNERTKAVINLPTNPGGLLTLGFIENVTPKITRGAQSVAVASDPAVSGYYFPGRVSVPFATPADQVLSSAELKYVEQKFIYQTLTIPFKFRPGLRDTIKSAASASFNVGFAGVFKTTVNRFKQYYWNDNGTASPLTHRIRKITYAFGPYLGPTVIDLKPGNTDQKVAKDRSVIGLTYGAVGVIGFNEFNVGVSLGFDSALSEGSKWIYQGKPWLGIVLALDIIK